MILTAHGRCMRPLLSVWWAKRTVLEFRWVFPERRSIDPQIGWCKKEMVSKSSLLAFSLKLTIKKTICTVWKLWLIERNSRKYDMGWGKTSNWTPTLDQCYASFYLFLCALWTGHWQMSAMSYLLGDKNVQLHAKLGIFVAIKVNFP